MSRLSLSLFCVAHFLSGRSSGVDEITYPWNGQNLIAYDEYTIDGNTEASGPSTLYCYAMFEYEDGACPDSEWWFNASGEDPNCPDPMNPPMGVTCRPFGYIAASSGDWVTGSEVAGGCYDGWYEYGGTWKIEFYVNDQLKDTHTGNLVLPE